MSKIQDISRFKLILGQKYLVFGLGGVYIYQYSQRFSEVQTQWTEDFSGHKILFLISVLLIFSGLNWFGEIKKWESLVGDVSTILSAKQTLIAHGLSLFTPQKLGEYGGKCLFYKESDYYRIIAFTAVGHFTQLLSTMVIGVFGIIVLFNQFNISEVLNFKWSWAFLVFPVLYFVKPIRQKTTKILEVLKNIEMSKIGLALGWSIFRYVFFAHQFYILLLCFNLDIPYFTALAAISLVYFIASLLPVFSIADALVKGSLALSIFGLLGFNSPAILMVVFLMWFSNSVLPAVIGYFWMFSWNPKPFKAQS